MDWLSFLSYVFLNCITPGPNNTISLSGAAQRGFLYSLRMCLWHILFISK